MKKSLLLFVLLIHFSAGFILSQNADIIIKNARIIDGSGSPSYAADIAISKGKILKIGDLGDMIASRIIEAEGQVVSPGFIDVHAHIEGSILQRPYAHNFIRNGVTTLVTGNCGSSSTDLKAFFNEVKKARPALNLSALIGHNSVRRSVMGEDNRAPTAGELKQMKQLVDQGMKDGAVGFSTGLIYVPGTYAETNEVVELAKVAASHGGIYASHIRNEANNVTDAIEEAVNIGIQANMPVEISHFKISSKVLWGQSKMTVGMIKDYRSKGIDVTVDQYPYPASSTTLAVLLPTWSLGGGNDSLVYRLNQPEVKAQIIREMKEELKGNGLDDYQYCAVSNCPWDQSFNGLRIPQVSEIIAGGNDLDSQIETVLTMVSKGDRVQMVFHKMSEEDVKFIMQYPYTMIASDAGITAFGERVPHPRAYGTNSPGAW